MTVTIRTRDGYEVRIRPSDDGSTGIVVAFPTGGCAATFRPTEAAAIEAAKAIISEKREGR